MPNAKGREGGFGVSDPSRRNKHLVRFTALGKQGVGDKVRSRPRRSLQGVAYEMKGRGIRRALLLYCGCYEIQIF
jgi:hypothetical protein